MLAHTRFWFFHFRLDFEHHLEKECPEGKQFYRHKPHPKGSGFIIGCANHKTNKSRGSMSTHITNRLYKAMMNFTNKWNLQGQDLVFPANPQCPNVPLKFYRHAYPMVRNMCPDLVGRVEFETGVLEYLSGFSKLFPPTKKLFTHLFYYFWKT